jgi:hypothetical protein
MRTETLGSAKEAHRRLALLGVVINNDTAPRLYDENIIG